MRLAVRLLEGRHAEVLAVDRHVIELVRVVLYRVVGTHRRIIAILPRTMRKIEPAHGGNDLLAEHGIPGLIGGVPDSGAWMIPVIAHPLGILENHFVRVEANLAV